MANLPETPERSDDRSRTYVGIAAAGGHLAWQYHTVNLNSPADCLRMFKSNHLVGAIVFAAIVAGKIPVELAACPCTCPWPKRHM